MPVGIIGKKLGHTRVYDANGIVAPVTVVLAGPNRVLQVKAKDGKDRVWLILHTGARAKGNTTKGMQIADPAGLLEWLAKDRCLVTFDNAKEIRVKRAALEAVVREWIRHL